MNATTINQLCGYLPPPELDVVRDNFRMEVVDNSLGIRDPELSRFLWAYKDMQFGWNFARTMAMNRLEMPSLLAGRDEWLWRAYLYQKDPTRYRDAVLQRAQMFMGKNFAKEKAVMNALLIAEDVDIGEIAYRLSVPPQVVSAYEILFFNVLDRRSDHLFISSIVYPQGRLVECFPRYVETEGLDMILLRAGYNHGAVDVLWFAGFPSRLLQSMQGNDVAGRLEGLIMANGLLLARNGWLNQGPSASGLHNARNLIAAAKMSGIDDSTSPFFAAGPGQTMMAEMKRIKQMQNRERTTAYHARKSDVIEVPTA